MGGKLFSSMTMFELARLWASQRSYLSSLYEAFAREVLTICQDRVPASFLCVLPLLSVLES